MKSSTIPMLGPKPASLSVPGAQASRQSRRAWGPTEIFPQGKRYMKLTVAEHARLNWERLKTVIAAWVAGSVVLSSILIVFIFSRQSSFWQTVWIIVAAEVAINLPFAIWYGLRRIPRSRIGTPSNDLDGRL